MQASNDLKQTSANGQLDTSHKPSRANQKDKSKEIKKKLDSTTQ